jgi:23S rRNA pseudouridine1911/1915/1917 synthase
MKRDGSQVFHIAADEAQTTLAALLRKRLPELSWNQARKLIHGRRVQIHGNLCVDEGRRLKEGEVVKVLPQAQALPPRDDDVRIRYVDAHVVVVEKPAGMTTLRHREERQWADDRKQRQPTLDEALARVLAKRAAGPAPSGKLSGKPSGRPSSKPSGKPSLGPPPAGGYPPGKRGSSEPMGRVARGRQAARGGRADAERRPIVVPVRPVHRLDRETSGLMVFARTVPAERSLVQQFRRHSIHRAYVAIAHGTVEPATIVSRLVRDRGDGRRGSTNLPEVGQRSVTHVRPLERLGNYTLVACRLETGRTHQIRIHLAESGHFLCGDKVYCQPLFQKTLDDRSHAPRCALHATELGFTHPITGERLRFEMPLPADLQQLLDRLRKASGSAATGSPTVPADGWPASLERLSSLDASAPADDEADVDDADDADDVIRAKTGRRHSPANAPPEGEPPRARQSREPQQREPQQREPQQRRETSRSERERLERGRLERGRDERGRDERGRDERGRDERGRDERGRDERGPSASGREGVGRDERGRDERARRGRSRPANPESAGRATQGGRRFRRRSKDR